MGKLNLRMTEVIEGPLSSSSTSTIITGTCQEEKQHHHRFRQGSLAANREAELYSIGHYNNPLQYHIAEFKLTNLFPGFDIVNGCHIRTIWTALNM